MFAYVEVVFNYNITITNILLVKIVLDICINSVNIY